MSNAQLALFELEAPRPPAPTWTRLDNCAHKLMIVHRHNPSGLTVHHCGHPTANFPYYINTPDGERILNPLNGRGFQKLEQAKEHVERMSR